MSSIPHVQVSHTPAASLQGWQKSYNRPSDFYTSEEPAEDRTYKLDFDTVAAYGRYVKSLWEAPWRADDE